MSIEETGLLLVLLCVLEDLPPKACAEDYCGRAKNNRAALSAWRGRPRHRCWHMQDIQVHLIGVHGM